jgi:purine-binding chemotaxis protein CheW
MSTDTDMTTSETSGEPIEPQDAAATGSGDIEVRAAELVNPESGLANDYLNHFNEVFLLVENLPILLPEMLDELLAWSPVTYREYFTHSPLPGSVRALEIYDSLDKDFRLDFETIIEGITALATASIQMIRTHRGPTGEIDGDEVTEFCQAASITMRTALTRAADLVNHGRRPSEETPQETVERLMGATDEAETSAAPEEAPPAVEATEQEVPEAEPETAIAVEADAAESVEVNAKAPEESPVEAQTSELEIGNPEPPPVLEVEAEQVEVSVPETMRTPSENPKTAPPSEARPTNETKPVINPTVNETSAMDETSEEESCFTLFSAGEAFGLSVLKAQTIFRISSFTPIPLGPSDIVGLVNLRGRIVTAVSLRRRLGIPDEALEESLAICIEHKGENFALIVDEVGDILSLNASMRVKVPRHFDAARSRYMTGLYKVDNLLVPVLDIAALFDFGSGANAGASPRVAA